MSCRSSVTSSVCHTSSNHLDVVLLRVGVDEVVPAHYLLFEDLATAEPVHDGQVEQQRGDATRRARVQHDARAEVVDEEGDEPRRQRDAGGGDAARESRRLGRARQVGVGPREAAWSDGADGGAEEGREQVQQNGGAAAV